MYFQYIVIEAENKSTLLKIIAHYNTYIIYNTVLDYQRMEMTKAIEEINK